MQVASLLKLLSDFAILAESIGGPSAAQNLKDLQRLFVGHEGETVAKCVGALSKRKPAGDKIESGAIRNIRGRLSRLHDLLLNAQCKKAASDIALLINLLKDCDQSDVAQFVADANSWMTKPQGKIKGGNTELRTDVVAVYLDKLHSSEGENDLFDQVMQSLRVDKRARLAEVREIASKYLGFEIAKKKSKIDALKAIADHQAFNARQIARGENQS